MQFPWLRTGSACGPWSANVTSMIDCEVDGGLPENSTDRVTRALRERGRRILSSRWRRRMGRSIPADSSGTMAKPSEPPPHCIHNIQSRTHTVSRPPRPTRHSQISGPPGARETLQPKVCSLPTGGCPAMSTPRAIRSARYFLCLWLVSPESRHPAIDYCTRRTARTW